MEAIFWISVGLIFYTFIGYPILITLLSRVTKNQKGQKELDWEDLPPVTLMIAAYNEEDIIKDKIENSLKLTYPKDKLDILFVTDGTTDDSLSILRKQPEVDYSHSPARKGKIAAINRVMSEIKTPITIFTDANVMLNLEAVWKMVNHFQSNNVAAVSGEKVVLSPIQDAASGTGEGAYWRYESYLKKKDAEWNTLVGSAGELLGIRTHLFTPTPEDTVIEDFVMTVNYAIQGYKVAYEPEARAVETASANVEEEEKRKIRISAGGIQAISRLPQALNFVSNPKLAFQYISHRALRWTLVPLAFATAFFSSFFLIKEGWVFSLALAMQVIFYGFAFIGYFYRDKATKRKILHLPYYFTFMQICVVKGWGRFFKGSQKVTWEKARRAVQVSA